MMPTNVCDAHEPPRSTSYGREIDLTSAAQTPPNDAFVTVWLTHLTLREARRVESGQAGRSAWSSPSARGRRNGKGRRGSSLRSTGSVR